MFIKNDDGVDDKVYDNENADKYNYEHNHEYDDES